MIEPLTSGDGWPWQPVASRSNLPADMAWPRISVITPIYNSATFLERAIRSIMLQGYPNLEHIVLDGGSTDGTAEILRHYDSVISYWESAPDKGQSDALNRGLDRATGEILCWLNGDDLFLPGALFAIAEQWLRSPNSDLILANASIVNHELEHIHTQPYTEIGPEAFLDWRKNYIIQPGLFFSSRAWQRCRPVREDLHYSMDFDLFYRMSKEFPIVRVNQLVAYSVFHPDCKTVRDKGRSIVETAMAQCEHGGWDIAKRELYGLADEHKYMMSLRDVAEGPVGRGGGRLNVLFVITELHLGGGQTFMLRLIAEAAKSCNVFLFVLWDHQIDPMLRARLPKDCVDLTGLDLRNQEAFRRAVISMKIDVVNTHLFHADRFVIQSLQHVRVAIVITDHGDYRYAIEEGLTTREQCAAMLRRANAIVTISSNNHEVMTGYGPDVVARLRPIPLGVGEGAPAGSRMTIRRMLGIGSEAFVYCCVARGIREKGWETLVDAFLEASGRIDRETHLILVGDGPYLRELKGFVNSNDLANVHFAGSQGNPESWMEAADINVLLSTFPGESSPTSLIEGFSLGRPAIASAVGGVPELIAPADAARSGLLVPLLRPGTVDRAAALAAMIAVATDPALYAELSDGARRLAKRYRISEVGRAYVKLFAAVAGGEEPTEAVAVDLSGGLAALDSLVSGRTLAALDRILDRRGDVREAFDLNDSDKCAELLLWVLRYGIREEPTLAQQAVVVDVHGALMRPSPRNLMPPETPLTWLMVAMWSGRPDLRRLFDVSTAEGQQGLLAWFTSIGRHELEQALGIGQQAA